MAAITEALWRLVAYLVTRKPVTRWIIQRARRQPYFHLTGYMNRWWLFNGYPPKDEDGQSRQDDKPFPWLPSVRVHHILRKDLAGHPHDHPWDFRTFILDGWYVEERPDQPSRLRARGDTASIRFGEYHHVAQVSRGGVWTLVILFRHRGKWGFLVNGQKMRPNDYVAEYPQRRTE